MANSVRIDYTNTAGATTSIYLSGSGTAYSGSGSPWTAQATSPYQTSMNDVTGNVWTPMAPTPVDVLSGTPPFSEGAEAVYRGYANVEETIGIQMYGTTADNAATLLSVLRRALSTPITVLPPLLIVQYDGFTNAVSYEIVSGSLQEDPRFANEEARLSPRLIRAALKIRRRPLAGGQETTINNAASMNNSGTSAPTNMLTYGAGRGDTIFEGAPLNLKIDCGASSPTRMYLASALARSYTTTGAATYTTSSTTGAVSSNVSSVTATSYVNYAGIKVRLLVHASVAANAQFRIEVGLSSASTQPFYVSPWISSTAGVAQLIDCGGFALSALRANTNFSSYVPSVSIRYRSVSGASVSTVVTSFQYLFYYDWMVVNPDYTNGLSTAIIVLDSYNYLIQSAPRSPRVYSVTGTSPSNILDARGTAPRYYSGAALFCAYLTGATGLYTPANTMTVTVQQLAQYHTLRGGSL